MKLTLAEFSWQVDHEQCALLLELHKESHKRFLAFMISFLRWYHEGAKRDRIDAHTPETLRPFEKQAFRNMCASHLARFRTHHDGKAATTRKATVAQSVADTRPTRDEINALCQENGRDPEEYGKRIWDEFNYYNWKDREGRPISNYRAYITKQLFPLCDKTLAQQERDIRPDYR